MKEDGLKINKEKEKCKKRRSGMMKVLKRTQITKERQARITPLATRNLKRKLI